MDKNAKQNIYPCILFNDEATRAAQFYVDTFQQSKILVEIAAFTLFEIGGYKFKAINSYNSEYKSNPAFSFMVSFTDEKELENTWRKLKMDGIVIMPLSEQSWSPKYGWIQDQFGISWHLLISESPASTFQKIAPVLVFSEEIKGRAEIASNFYVEVFKKAKRDIPQLFETGEFKGMVKHSPVYIQNYLIRVMESAIEQPFEFSPGISLVVECETQEEIDYYWNAFAFGGEEGSAGWVKDKFGIYWQIIPQKLNEWIVNPAINLKIISEIKNMKKIEISKLEPYL